MWIMFFFSDKVTALMLTTTTPVLVGMFMIAVLLPALMSRADLAWPHWSGNVRPRPLHRNRRAIGSTSPT
jgi:hypothetical protein